jgi:hypothetical protein
MTQLGSVAMSPNAFGRCAADDPRFHSQSNITTE